jgi:hypothetical protein
MRRLEKLECENCRLRRLVVLAGLAGIVPATAFLAGTYVRPSLAAQTQSDLQTIQAYEFILRDSAGRTRAHLFFSDVNGSPMLSFNDQDGRPRLILGADDRSTSIQAYSPNGGSFVATSTASSDGAIVEASSSERGTPEGSASMSAFKDVTQMEAEDANGFKTIIGNAAIADITTKHPQYTNGASLVMYERNGHIVWKAPPGGR